MGGDVFPPCCFAWGQTMYSCGNNSKVMAISFKRTLPTLLYSVPLTLHQATVEPCLHWRLLDTHRQVWFSILWGHCSFLLAPGVHKVLFVPSNSLFSQYVNPTGLQSQIPCGFSVHLQDPQVRKWVVGPTVLLTVWGSLWYNCSAVCGLSAWWLYCGANSDLLQEGLCHMLRVPGLLKPEPLSPCQATADPCLNRRYSNTQRQIWISLCGASGYWCVQGFVCALWASLGGMGFDSKHDFTPPTIC